MGRMSRWSLVSGLLVACVAVWLKVYLVVLPYGGMLRCTLMDFSRAPLDTIGMVLGAVCDVLTGSR